jgi:hypothetical protein
MLSIILFLLIFWLAYRDAVRQEKRNKKNGTFTPPPKFPGMGY